MNDMKPVLEPEQTKLVEDNVMLARFLAKKRWDMAPGVLDYEELISLAFGGLISAAIRWRTYCEEKGYSEESIVSGEYFSIFARKRIIGSILDWQRSEADHVPRSYRADFKILQRHGYPDRVKNHEELALLSGLTVDRIKAVIYAVDRTPVSMDEMIEDDPADTPMSHHNVEGSALLTSVGEAVAATVAKLPEGQQLVLALRYFENLDLQAISVELDTSITFVREAHNAGIEAVYEALVATVSED